MSDEKIFPVEEMLAYKGFTDRVEILRELDAWVKNIQRMAASNTAIIAPQRMGKPFCWTGKVITVAFRLFVPTFLTFLRIFSFPFNQ